MRKQAQYIPLVRISKVNPFLGGNVAIFVNLESTSRLWLSSRALPNMHQGPGFESQHCKKKKKN